MKKHNIDTRSNDVESKTLLQQAIIEGKTNLAASLILMGEREVIDTKDGNGKDIFD
ncbi:MAG: hypothetical protein PV340_03625 [Wolbachia sp.]|nr:hypothetical protein [Wolbachia sp.]MDD9336207.1 hypothetical protein [Wolbachia sp.]